MNNDIWSKDKPLNLEKIAEHFKEKCVFGPEDLQRMAMQKAHGVVLEKKASFQRLCNALVPGSMEKYAGDGMPLNTNSGKPAIEQGSITAQLGYVNPGKPDVLAPTPTMAATAEEYAAKNNIEGANTGTTLQHAR